jgi:hypothetical protein
VSISARERQTPGKLKPALSPEHDVHQDNLRPELLCPLERLSRGSGNTDDAQASLFQAIAGGLEKQQVVVHNQDPDRRHVTSVPASAVPRIGASRNRPTRSLSRTWARVAGYVMPGGGPVLARTMSSVGRR